MCSANLCVVQACIHFCTYVSYTHFKQFARGSLELQYSEVVQGLLPTGTSTLNANLCVSRCVCQLHVCLSICLQGNISGHDEYVIYNPYRTLPEYVIEYTTPEPLGGPPLRHPVPGGGPRMLAAVQAAVNAVSSARYSMPYYPPPPPSQYPLPPSYLPPPAPAVPLQPPPYPKPKRQAHHGLR